MRPVHGKAGNAKVDGDKAEANEAICNSLLLFLSQTLPEHRRPALHAQLELLDRTIEKLHAFP